MYHLPSLLLGTLLVSSITVPAQLTGSAVLTFDFSYADPSSSFDGFACSGSLEAKGYSTIGSLPNVGLIYPCAAFVVEGWDSSECGSCFKVTYYDTTTDVLVVDKVDSGFVVSIEAMSLLTGEYQSPPSFVAVEPRFRAT